MMRTWYLATKDHRVCDGHQQLLHKSPTYIHVAELKRDM